MAGLADGPDAPPGSAGEHRTSEVPGSGRLSRRDDGSFTDAWTGRAIECVPLTDEVLERARIFARAAHDGLQPVLRVDREGGLLWLASCTGALDRPLTATERVRLQGALDALQAAGAGPASADEGLAGVGPSGEVVVRFAAPQRSSTIA